MALDNIVGHSMVDSGPDASESFDHREVGLEVAALSMAAPMLIFRLDVLQPILAQAPDQVRRARSSPEVSVHTRARCEDRPIGLRLLYEFLHAPYAVMSLC